MGRVGICTIVVAAGWLAGCDDESPAGTPDSAPDLASDAAGADPIDDAPAEIGPDADASPDLDEPDPEDLSADPLPDADAPDLPPDLGPEIPEGPPAALLTIAELPAAMNGSEPYFDGDAGPFEFTLVAPTFGFTLDVLADRPPDFLDPDSLEVSCDAPMGDLEAGAELAGEFAWTDRIRWLVPESRALASGLTVTCTGRVANLEGEASQTTSVTFETLAMTPELHPFDPQDTWIITFSRDRYDIDLVIEEGDYSVEATQIEGGDGEADFDEDLALLGLRGDESGVGADAVEGRGVVGANAIAREWLIDETLRQVRMHYYVDPETGLPSDDDSVNIRILREGDPGVPDPVFDETFSIHGLGGDAPPDEPTQFGRASAIDERNATAQDDSRLGYGSFTSSLARQVLLQPAGRLLMREVLPGMGIPIGQSPLDAEILADGFDPDTADSVPRRRYRQIDFLMEFLSKALASLVAHEIGHSLGLVACGPPPGGLFGGVYDERWMESDVGCAHIDIAGLNIMQTGGALLENPQDIQSDVRFEPLSLAYLRGRIILVP